METINSNHAIKEKSFTDNIIDGVVAGLVAGFGMGLLLIVAGWASGGDPVEIMKGFVPWQNPTPLLGVLLHLAVSSVYGMCFGGVVFTYSRFLANFPVWIAGILYGAVLFLVAQFIVLPGVDSQLQTLPPWLFAAAHLFYGGILGWWMNRQSG